MSTLQKVKAYFGMVPLEDIEQEYPEELHNKERSRSRYRSVVDYDVPPAEQHNSFSGHHQDGFVAGDPRVPASVAPASGSFYTPSVASWSAQSEMQTGPITQPLHARAPYDDRRVNTHQSRETWNPVSGALALRPMTDREGSPLFDDSSALARIIMLRPQDYNEARVIGENYRDGSPVIMDLMQMSNAEAKRLVDFAAGLAFALRGSFDKVAAKVFLLSPADVNVTAEDRQKIAEKGFYTRNE